MDNREMLRQGSFVAKEYRKMTKMMSSPDGEAKYNQIMARRARRWAKVERNNEFFDNISDNTALTTFLALFLMAAPPVLAILLFLGIWG